jgi:hypothetical protein
MVKVLRTRGISHYLHQIITNANNKLILVSPFLQVSGEIKAHIKKQTQKNIDVKLISRKKSFDIYEEWFDNLNSSNSFSAIICNDLHAKCYLNESEALITSMNLYDYSIRNNEEIGVYVSKADDNKVYEDILKMIDEIIKENINLQESDDLWYNDGLYGFCIICGSDLYDTFYDEFYYHINNNDNCKCWNQAYCCKFCHDIIQKVGFNVKNYIGFYCVDCGELINMPSSLPLCTEHFNQYKHF